MGLKKKKKERIERPSELPRVVGEALVDGGPHLLHCYDIHTYTSHLFLGQRQTGDETKGGEASATHTDGQTLVGEKKTTTTRRQGR